MAVCTIYIQLWYVVVSVTHLATPLLHYRTHFYFDCSDKQFKTSVGNI